MSRISNILKAWIPLAVVVTGLAALAFVLVQQALRQGANDPQIQMAEDAAAALNAGAGTAGVVQRSQLDLASSQAPFVAIYDPAGKPVASSALLDGQLPEYPVGALQAAKQTDENRVTWQPRAGVRIASVAVPYKDGYVVAGRSLREVEQRESQAKTNTLILWVLTMAASLVAVAFVEFAFRPG